MSHSHWNLQTVSQRMIAFVCLNKKTVFFVERASNCTKILNPDMVSQYFCVTGLLLATCRKGFHLSYLDHRSDSQKWRTQLVCPSWDWLLLELSRGSLLTSILFRCWRDKSYSIKFAGNSTLSIRFTSLNGPFKSNERFIRWSAEVGNSWTSQQDGLRFSVALVPKRRSGQRQQWKFTTRRSHQTFRESSFEPQRGIGSAGVSWSVGSFGRVRFRGGSLNFCGMFQKQARRSAQPSGHRNAARRSNCWRMPQSVWPGCGTSNASVSSNSIGRASHRVEGEVGRCGSGTRCTRCAEAMWNPRSCQDPVPERPRRREELIPNCEAMQQWMEEGSAAMLGIFQKLPGSPICWRRPHSFCSKTRKICGHS